MVSEPKAVADLLGIRPRQGTSSAFELIARIEGGLPVAALDRVASTVAPKDAEFRYRLVPKATLARRKNARRPRLSVEESDRLARIAGIWAHARAVWKDDDAARAFLFRPHPMLEGRRPIDAAVSTELGADLVDQVLGGLEHGSAA
jgi:putative toxin-antitoxin system antitoxin component (TIGR02293 family)